MVGAIYIYIYIYTTIRNKVLSSTEQYHLFGWDRSSLKKYGGNRMSDRGCENLKRAIYYLPHIK